MYTENELKTDPIYLRVYNFMLGDFTDFSFESLKFFLLNFLLHSVLYKLYMWHLKLF